MQKSFTLESLSYDVIFKNFSRYILGYETSQDYRFRKNMFFLQKIYSEKLLYELKKENVLKEIYLDFLLNEYLQNLDISVPLRDTNSNKDKIIEKLISISHTFVILSCSEYLIGENEPLDIFQSIIPHAVNVQIISIPFQCNDKLLKLIASSCSHLTELYIQYSFVTDQGLTALSLSSENPAQNPCKLKYINLTSVKVTLEGVMDILKNIPSLQQVTFNDVPKALYSLHKVDIDKNSLCSARKYNLIALDFKKYSEDSSLLLTLLRICAELCPFVRDLDVPITVQECLDVCLLYSHLESLTLVKHIYSHRIDLNNFLLKKGKNLKFLAVQYCSLSVPNLVENSTNLETLSITEVNHKHKDKKSSQILKKLKVLEIDDSVIELLNVSPNVETLYLHKCKFGESTLLGNLSRFAFNTSLKHLYIFNSDLKANLAQQIILSCCFLETLSLKNCDNFDYNEKSTLENFIKTSNRKIELSCVIKSIYDNFDSFNDEFYMYDSNDAYDLCSNCGFYGCPGCMYDESESETEDSETLMLCLPGL